MLKQLKQRDLTLFIGIAVAIVVLYITSTFGTAAPIPTHNTNSEAGLLSNHLDFQKLKIAITQIIEP